MTQMILAITKQTIDQRDLLQVLEENGIPGLSFISVDTIEDAEPCFFENDILLLIADYNIPGVVEAFMEMKQDEVFCPYPGHYDYSPAYQAGNTDRTATGI